MTKYVICIPDGAADYPLAELGGRTPLQVAVMPTLAKLATRSHIGSAATIPVGLPAGSDVGIMSILGYDPRRYWTGRAPLEAAARGINLEAKIVFRVNLVTVGSDGILLDAAGGSPSQRDAEQAIAAFNTRLGGEFTFYPGIGYRNLMTAPTRFIKVLCTPPHELIGRSITPPTGPGADILIELENASRGVLADLSITANQIRLWGQGQATVIPSFVKCHEIQAAMVCAVDVARGIATLAGLTLPPVNGATGGYNTNYEAKRDTALAALHCGADLAVIHVEATDEAGHAGDLNEKIKALEAWDKRILRPMTESLNEFGHWRMLFLPDHATPLVTRTHARVPVPYLIYDSTHWESDGRRYSEADVASAYPVRADVLVRQLRTHVRGTHPMVRR
jgi:2,3-bisphosphoglycerate-independent phosphoglycerate mutase